MISDRIFNHHLYVEYHVRRLMCDHDGAREVLPKLIDALKAMAVEEREKERGGGQEGADG